VILNYIESLASVLDIIDDGSGTSSGTGDTEQIQDAIRIRTKLDANGE
jgi:hypothetical protein